MALPKSMFQKDLTFAIGDFDNTLTWSGETIPCFAPVISTGENLMIDGIDLDVTSMNFFTNISAYTGTPEVGDEITYNGNSIVYRIKRIQTDPAKAWYVLECEDAEA